MSGIIRVEILRKRTWTPDLMSLELDYRAKDFQPGQFFNLSLEVDGKEVRRSYSAASEPGAQLEFFFSRVAEGSLSPRLFDLSVGDELSLNQVPYGSFTLEEIPPAASLWMVATGTGLAPFLSILRGGELWERFEEIVLVHGVRQPQDLAYQEELQTLSERQATLQYIPILSSKELRQTPEPAPGALSGRITKAWGSGALVDAVGRSFDANSHMMLCGNPKMIEDMSALLNARGFQKHRRRAPGHFSFEKYW